MATVNLFFFHNGQTNELKFCFPIQVDYNSEALQGKNTNSTGLWDLYPIPITNYKINCFPSSPPLKKSKSVQTKAAMTLKYM